MIENKVFVRVAFPWLPIRVSIHLRLASDDSPFVLRSFFDSRTELERRLNGESTEDERRTNGERTENERRTIRETYRRICWLDCDIVSLLMIFQELIKVDFETFLLGDGLYNNTLQKPSAYKDFTAECRTFSDVLLENNFVVIT